MVLSHQSGRVFERLRAISSHHHHVARADDFNIRGRSFSMCGAHDDYDERSGEAVKKVIVRNDPNLRCGNILAGFDNLFDNPQVRRIARRQGSSERTKPGDLENRKSACRQRSGDCLTCVNANKSTTRTISSVNPSVWENARGTSGARQPMPSVCTGSRKENVQARADSY